MSSITMLMLIVFQMVLVHPAVYAIYSTNVTIPGYHKWRPINSTRDDLYCPDTCERFLEANEPRKYERCCSCESLPCTHINSSVCGVTVQTLHLEEYDIFGHSVFITTDDADFYEFEHRHGRLTAFPDNICDFADSLMTIDVSYNHITNISAIKCLNKLDTLILDSNEITVVENNTFSHMKFIRVVSIQSNNIEILQPQTNKIKAGNILQFSVSHNVMDNLDLSNVYISGVICNFDCEGCQIGNLANEVNINMTERSGYGFYNFKNSTSAAWINLTNVGMETFADLWKYDYGSFDYDNSSIGCDCSIYPLFAFSGDLREFYPFVNSSLTCIKPDYMAGKNITWLYENKRLDELICHLPNCPLNCQCTDVPVREAVIVECKKQSELPEFIPRGNWNNENIILDLSHKSNSITRFSDKDYLDRIDSIDFGNNSIIDIDVHAIEKLDNNRLVSLDISEQKLEHLPSSFYRLDPNVITFGTNPVQCDCDNTWVGDWIRSNKAYNRVWCSTEHGVYLAESVTRELLKCDNYEQFSPLIKSAIITVSLTALSAILGVFLAHYFRYELFLLKRRYFNARAKNDDCEFDVMLSFSCNNEEMFEWVSKSAINRLEKAGYSLFVPYFSVPLYEDKETEVAKGIQNSKCYVICLSRDYLSDENAVHEFETTWNKFYKDASKNFIVINWENLECSDISSKQIRAAFRINDDLNYMDRNTKLFDRLIERLGPVRTPLHKRKGVFGNLTNDGNDTKPQLKQNAMFEGACKPVHRGHRIQCKPQLLDQGGETSGVKLNSNTRFKERHPWRN